MDADKGATNATRSASQATAFSLSSFIEKSRSWICRLASFCSGSRGLPPMNIMELEIAGAFVTGCAFDS
jgi:hypothetical protein